MLVWLSLDTWLISLLSIAYLILLFIVAYYGQKGGITKWQKYPWVYSLALGVSCTSWAFYGTVGQAALTGAWLAPVYFGSIGCFVLAWPMLLRILRITKQQNLTSIADFIACRYDRSPQVAAIVTLVALLGTIPYITLQLRAISTSFDLVTGSFQSGTSTTFVVTLVLIVFSILFGARQVAVNKQNQGLVLAIAFSSIVKLFALTAIGIFATFFVFDGVQDLLHQTQGQSQDIQQVSASSGIYFAISQAILGAFTIFILPQQYHMLMIENHHEKELKNARWLYPLYLILINLFILPIALAGQNLFPGGSVNADTYVITIPLFFHQAWLGGLVYIGGLAAATSMVIIATIVLSTMVTTEIVNPLLLHYNSALTTEKKQVSTVLLNMRRMAIALLLMLAFGFERIIDPQRDLAAIGLLSFVLLGQLAPLVLGALYWRKATTRAALTGLMVGSAIWLYTLLLPGLFPDADWVKQGPFAIHWLQPEALFNVSFLDAISHGLLFSLLANSGCFILISLLSHRSVGEKLQAELFLNKQQSSFEQRLSRKDLIQLLQRFVSDEAAGEFQRQFPEAPKSRMAKAELLDYTRLQLSSVLGSASTRMVMKAATKQQVMPLEDVVNIVDEASELFQFNRELLQAGVENIEQGISIVDADMRIVAWNQRYIELLDYPENLVIIGKPVADLIRYNAERGVIVRNKELGQDSEGLINRRLEHMRNGDNHYVQRQMPNGIVLEIRGQAMPGGGFVSTFSDITAHVKAEKALQQANEKLEQRVAERTQELSQAKAEAEAANSSKSRFLAAASHDLMQPFNALSLFTNMLNKKVQGSDLQELAGNIQNSLTAAESLLSDLVEISRLDGNAEKIDVSDFMVDDLLATLSKEFTLLAQQAGLGFSYMRSSRYIRTDQRLLRRVIQNFLSNAINYCSCTGRKGKVLLGVRQGQEYIRIEVWDNGPGIPADKLQAIFKEFERLDQTQERPGLGLGLAISDRIAKLLNLSISVQSEVGKGTCFAISIPRIEGKRTEYKRPVQRGSAGERVSNEFSQLPVLIIDNEHLMLTAMQTQLQEWGCRVLSAADEHGLKQALADQIFTPALIISDYHLDNDQNGVDLMQEAMSQYGWNSPCIICSADPSEQVRAHTSSANFNFMRKPIKPLALKKMMRQLLA